MYLLLKNALIIDPGSSHHLCKKDILISHGIIDQIEDSIEVKDNYTCIESEHLCVSKGWVDLHVHVPDPGMEHREDILSASKAAAFGGFTGVALHSDPEAAINQKSDVDYIINKSLGTMVHFYALGAVTKNVQGKELNEMYDMYQSGAVAFSDGTHSIQNSGLLQRSLEYMKSFDGVLFHHPEDRHLSAHGHMHECAMSVQLGLHAMPALAESVCVARDIKILEYTQSRLHFIDISTKESVALIREAKQKGLQVSASINAINLMYNADALLSFDTGFKLNPPLRDTEDIQALIEGVKDGTIDTITSGHQPIDEEAKNLEFDLASFGMTALETCYAVANSALSPYMSAEEIIAKFTSGVEKVLGEYCYTIEKGNNACITFFDPEARWIFESKHQKSKSKNTPLFGIDFKGKVLGIVNKRKYSINTF